MLQRIPLGVKSQHLGREGKEILRVKRQPHHGEKRGNQKEEDQSTDKQETVMPKGLPACVINRHAFAIIARVDPEDEP